MAVAPILAIASVAISAAGTVLSGFQQAAASKASANIAGQQSAIARRDAEEEANRIRTNNRRILGANQATIGASGTVGGSLLFASLDAVSEGELQALTALYTGEKEAFGFDVRKSQLETQATTAIGSGIIGAGTSLLSAGGKGTFKPLGIG